MTGVQTCALPISVEESKKELTDSISYAERIQGAIMPPKSLVKSILPKSFILYLPKDVDRKSVV